MENQTKKYIEQLKEDPRINKTEGSDPPVKLVESVYLLDKTAGTGICQYIQWVLKDQIDLPVRILDEQNLADFNFENSLILIFSENRSHEEREIFIQKLKDISRIKSGRTRNDFALCKSICIPSDKVLSAEQVIFCLTSIAKVFSENQIFSEFQKIRTASVDLLTNNQKEMYLLAIELVKRIRGTKLFFVVKEPVFEAYLTFRNNFEARQHPFSFSIITTDLDGKLAESTFLKSRKNDFAVIFFRKEKQANSLKARIDKEKELLLQFTDRLVEIESKGVSSFEASLYLIVLIEQISALIGEPALVEAKENRYFELLSARRFGPS